MGDKFAVTGALKKIEQVLNHYRAFKDIEEALKVAAGVELLVSELGTEEARLRGVIADLEAQRVEAAEQVEILKAGGLAEYEKNEAMLKALAADWGEKIAALEDSVKALREEERAFLAARAVDVDKAQERILELSKKADAEEARYQKAQAALADLRGRI